MKKNMVYRVLSAFLVGILTVQMFPGQARAMTTSSQIGTEGDPAIAYFVDAGDQDPSTVNEGETLGIYNSVTDQIFGEDPVTGKSWGVNEDTEADALSGYTDGMNKGLSYRCGNTGYNVEYRFELPEGIYDIETGIPYYPSWGPRILDVSVSDGQQEITLAEAVNPAEIPEGDVRVIEGTIESKTSQIKVSFTKNQGGNWDPLVSYLYIYDRNGAMQSLNELAEKAESYQEADYTRESYEKLKKAMAEAAEIQVETHTSKQICQARENLQKAIDGLIRQNDPPREDADSSIAYFVDAGAYDPKILSGEDLFGTYNGVTDQAYGADPVTGYAWGYEGQTEPFHDTKPGMTKEESCRFGSTGWDFGYRFALAQGTYDVEIYVPKEDARRVFDVYLRDGEGERKLTESPLEAGSGPHIIYGQIQANGLDSQVAVDFRKPDTSYWDPVVSYIMIYDNAAAEENFKTLLMEVSQMKKEDYRAEGWKNLENAVKEAEDIQVSELEYPGRQLWEQMKKIREAVDQLISKEELALDFSAEGRTGGAVPERVYLREGETYVIPSQTPVREGYRFQGWSCGEVLYQAGETWTMPNTDVVLEARWAKIHTVTFGRSGGSGTLPESLEGIAGEQITVPESQLRKTGYTFAGWNDGTADYQPGESYVIPDRDVVLTAVWKQNPTYTISFQGGGGTGILPADMINEANEMVIIPECTLVREGYRFTGWSLEGIIYQPGDFFRMPNQDMLLTATWELVPVERPQEQPDPKPEEQPGHKPEEEAPAVTEPFCYVNFVSQGKHLQTQSVRKGERTKRPKVPKRKGYAFQGWYLGRQKYTFTEKVSGNLTLTAKWKKIKVGKSKLLSVKSKKKGCALIKVKKVTGADGYQISYTMNQRWKKGKKQKLVQKRSLTIQKLKRGKTYYVKVRAYRIDSSGRKVFGAYSGVKKVQIKG